MDFIEGKCLLIYLIFADRAAPLTSLIFLWFLVNGDNSIFAGKAYNYYPYESDFYNSTLRY